MLRAGIVGAGYIAEAHARGYAAQPAARARLVAVASRRPERAEALAGRYGATGVASFEALMEVGVDVVSICTPTPTHAEPAVAALRAGKHVLCEKPIARTVAQAEAMLQAARESGAKLMVGHNARYEADHRKAREVVERGDLGPLRMAFQSITAPLPEWSSDHWLADPAQSGGPLLDLAIHSFDTLLWLFGGRAVRVYALQNGEGARSYALASVRFDNGGMALVETSWAHPRAQALALRTELVGTRGRLEWDYEEIASLQVVDDRDGRRSLVMPGEDSILSQIDDFLRCVEADLPPPISGEEGLRALRVALAAVESAETGRAAAP